MIKKVVKKNKLFVIDFYSVMDGMLELFFDYIYFNEEGVKVMVKVVYDVIVK